MAHSTCTCLRTRVSKVVVATTAVSMFAAFGADVLATPAHHPFAIVDVAAVTQSPDTVGISDNDLVLSATDPATIAKQLDEMQALGVQNIRIAIPWATTEPGDGQYDWTAIDNMVDAADARGMGILAVVNTTPSWARAAGTSVYTPPTNAADFGAFMGALAARYAGKLQDYEVWNEPNAALGYAPGPDPAGYTALLKAAYPAIKAADPTATVIGGVLGSTISFGDLALDPVTFVQDMYADGAAGYFDALSFHPYQETTEFSQGANLANSPLNQVNAIYQLMVANGDGSKSIWASEYGLPTSVVGDAQQATYISDFLTAWSSLSYAGPSFIYSLVDSNSSDTTNPESTYGVYTDSWTPKLAAQVISDFIAAHPTSAAAAQAAAEQAAMQAVANSINAAIQAYVQGIAEAIQAALAAALSPPAPATPSVTPGPAPAVVTPVASRVTSPSDTVAASATTPTSSSPTPTTQTTPTSTGTPTTPAATSSPAVAPAAEAGALHTAPPTTATPTPVAAETPVPTPATPSVATTTGVPTVHSSPTTAP